MQKLLRFLRSRDTVRPSSARWLTDRLLVLGDPGQVSPAAAAEVAEPSVVAVLVGDGAGGPGVIDAVAAQVPDGTPCLLLAAGAGAPTAGQPPAAVLLARRLRSEVLAPAGPFHLVPGGTAFSPAGWVRVTPGGATIRHGTRHPAPWWGAALDELEGTAPPDVRVTPLPAGVWVCPTGTYRSDIRPPAFDTPPSHTRIQFILGHPDADPPATDQVDRLLDLLPPDLREHVVLRWTARQRGGGSGRAVRSGVPSAATGCRRTR